MEGDGDRSGNRQSSLMTVLDEMLPDTGPAAGDGERDHGISARRIKKPKRGAAMKYVAAIALVLALIAFLRAGLLECRVMGEALSPRCLLVGASLSWPKNGKNGDSKPKKQAAR